MRRRYHQTIGGPIDGIDHTTRNDIAVHWIKNEEISLGTDLFKSMFTMGANQSKTVAEEDQPSTSSAFRYDRDTTPKDLLEDSDDGSSGRPSEGPTTPSPMFATPTSGVRSTRKRLPGMTPRRSSPRKLPFLSRETSSDNSSDDEVEFVKVQSSTSSLSCAQPPATTAFKRTSGFLSSKRDSFKMQNSTLSTKGVAITSTEVNGGPPLAKAALPTRTRNSSESRDVTPSQPSTSKERPMCKKTVSRPPSIAEIVKKVVENGKNKNGSTTSSLAGSASALAAKKKRPAPRERGPAAKKKVVEREESPEICLIPRYLGAYKPDPAPSPLGVGIEANRTRVFADFVIQMLRNDERLNPALYNWKVRTITQTLMENEIPDGPRPST